MRAPKPRHRRSRLEWCTRIVLAFSLAFIGYQFVVHSLAVALPSGQGERAHRLAPNDAGIAAGLSENLSGADVTAIDRRRSQKLAQAALLRDPTAVRAVATLGINALLHGDGDRARRLFAYSQKLSRRDLRTQLWAIEDAVGRGDMSGALQHYDIALRTRPSAQDLLFPVLGSAIAEPAVRTQLVRTLSQKPLWRDQFIEYVAGNGPVPQATAQFLILLERAGTVVPQTAEASVISALINKDAAGEAWAYYEQRHPGVDQRRSRDPNFNGEVENPSAFDWSTVNDMGLSASMQRGEKNGLFDFAAPPGVGGVVLQQMQLLPPGNYILTGRSTGIEQPANSLPYWILSCRDGREIGRVSVRGSDQADGNFAGRFVVSEECPIQILALAIRPSDSVSGVAGQIEHVLLRPGN